VIVRNVRTLLVVACTLALAALVAAIVGALRPSAALAPDFTLTDQNGAPFTLSGLRGRPVALFFGYAHCADACPLVLARLAKVARAPGSARDLHVVFVTVDPERDSPAALKRYLAQFDPRFVGATGSAAQLAPVYAAYHIAHAAVSPSAGKSLEIEHETAVFLIGRDGGMRGIVPGDEDVATLAKEFAI
jgi:protein SCO1/2